MKNYRRKVEKQTICEKSHLRWDEQQNCKHFHRSSLNQDQCDYCNTDGWCELSYEDEAA